MSFSSSLRLKVHRVLVKDRQKLIPYPGGQVRTTFTDRRRGTPPLDLARVPRLEDVSASYPHKIDDLIVNWNLKRRQRSGPGTGRMRYMKTLSRRFKNGFRSGTKPKRRVKTK